MAKIFEHDTFTHGGSFRRGTSGALFSASGSISLVQNWNASFQLPIQEIYECGSSNVYFAATAPQGTLTIARIVSGKDTGANVFTESLYSDLCNPQSMVVATGDQQCAGKAVSLTLESVVMQSVGWSGQAANAYVDENVTFKFTGAEVS